MLLLLIVSVPPKQYCICAVKMRVPFLIENLKVYRPSPVAEMEPLESLEVVETR